MSTIKQPADYSVAELEEELEDIDDAEELEFLLETERDDQNRVTAIEAIEQRLESLDTDTDADADTDVDTDTDADDADADAEDGDTADATAETDAETDEGDHADETDHADAAGDDSIEETWSKDTRKDGDGETTEGTTSRTGARPAAPRRRTTSRHPLVPTGPARAAHGPRRAANVLGHARRSTTVPTGEGESRLASASSRRRSVISRRTRAPSRSSSTRRAPAGRCSSQSRPTSRPSMTTWRRSPTRSSCRTAIWTSAGGRSATSRTNSRLSTN
jgi:hypothetical protein